MTAALTDEAQTIVSHFIAHMPLNVRTNYEAKVREMLKHRSPKLGNEIEDETVQATRVCIDVMHALWEQARREAANAKCTLHLIPGGIYS